MNDSKIEVETMYLISARGRAGGMSIVAANATEAMSKLRDLDEFNFATIVYDDRGRERSLAEIEAEAADETRAFGMSRIGSPVGTARTPPHTSV